MPQAAVLYVRSIPHTVIVCLLLGTQSSLAKFAKPCARATVVDTANVARGPWAVDPFVGNSLSTNSSYRLLIDPEPNNVTYRAKNFKDD
jgi:hypothetical protein